MEAQLNKAIISDASDFVSEKRVSIICRFKNVVPFFYRFQFIVLFFKRTLLHGAIEYSFPCNFFIAVRVLNNSSTSDFTLNTCCLLSNTEALFTIKYQILAICHWNGSLNNSSILTACLVILVI